MATGGFDIAKAGWLFRQSTILHRWKKNWFTLDRQGDLRYFESPDSPRAEERIVVRAVVMHIKTGVQCRKTDPPEGVSRVNAHYIELMMRDKESMLLCAESMDDMKAWQITLEEARTLPAPAVSHVIPTSTTTIIAPPPYAPYGLGYSYGYPGYVISQPAVSQVYHTPAGTTTVVNAPPAQQYIYMDDSPYLYGRRRHYRLHPFYW